MSQDTIARFKALNRPLKFDDDIQPTELFPRREDVERSNTFRLNALDAETQTYTASDTGAVTDPVQREKMLANFMALHQLELRVGAQVMLIKNVDEQLVNGSIGKVMGFVHKALFTTDLQGRWMPEGDLADLEEDEREKRERLREMLLARASSSMKVLPVVEFRVPGGTRHMLVEHDTFKNELPNGEVQVQRSQVSPGDSGCYDI
jgi:ATP-dependent DNA helicase PIF1